MELIETDFSGVALARADLTGVDLSVIQPPTTTAGWVNVAFYPMIDLDSCVSRRTGVMNCVVTLGDYARYSVNCLFSAIWGVELHRFRAQVAIVQ